MVCGVMPCAELYAVCFVGVKNYPAFKIARGTEVRIKEAAEISGECISCLVLRCKCMFRITYFLFSGKSAKSTGQNNIH